MFGFATASFAQDALPLPAGASETFNSIENNTDTKIAIDVWNGRNVPVVALTGERRTRVWKSEGAGLTLAQMSEPILSYFLDQGFDLRLDCDAPRCGGFDFRYNVLVVDAPALFVDLRNFRFLSFSKGPNQTPEMAFNILVTKAFGTSYVQLVQATQNGTTPIQTTTTASTTKPAKLSYAPSGNISAGLAATGRAILSDLEYASGSSKLAQDRYASLAEIAEYLTQNTDKDIVLVGHSDNIGGLAINMSLAKKRAQSVVDLLVSNYGVKSSRISAEGAGYLSPLTTNDTKQGRDTNRRVEVIIAPPKK